ncbi:MAG: hypothetical protein OEY49_17770, partial [Candidatus Heimdallarchaeota archaeon]|nr:hypothetical protein [Candidatus Heimdallarchaeota archaeon]
MFELIEGHESESIRNLTLSCLENYYPKSNKRDVLELWIKHPLPQIISLIEKFVTDEAIDNNIKSAVFLMLNQNDKLVDLDQDHKHLDHYLRNLDPLMGSLLFQKANLLKSKDLRNESMWEEEESISILDRIRRRDFMYLWENILNYPLPFIIELLKIFYEEHWTPLDKVNQDTHELLLEFLGFEGWYRQDDVKWVVVSIQDQEKFRPLKPGEITNRIFDLKISTDLIFRPDRIKNKEFTSRGLYNLVKQEIGLNIYSETIRKSDFDGLLHIPIYSNNGVELAEFTIEANNEKYFQMDEDGLYFTVRTKQGLFSVDIDALAAILLPVSLHSEDVNEIIPIMLEKTIKSNKITLQGLKFLSDMHKGREFTLWDLKSISEIDNEEEAKDCMCCLAFDIDDRSTKITRVIGGDCDHEFAYEDIPTVIHYNNPNECITGNKLLQEQLLNSKQTYRNIISYILQQPNHFIQIHNKKITPSMALLDFIQETLNILRQREEFKLNRLAIAFPPGMPSSIELWIKEELVKLNLEIFITDKQSALEVAVIVLENHRGNSVYINIDNSSMCLSTTLGQGVKSRKKLQEARIRELNKIVPKTIAKLYHHKGYLNLRKELKVQDTITTEEFIKLFDDKISETEFFKHFKLILRNQIAKSSQRKFNKKQLDSIIIYGELLNFSKLKNYISDVFDKSELIYIEDKHLISKGAGILMNNQRKDLIVNEDIMLRTSKKGIISFNSIIKRGEELTSKLKKYEIRPHSWFDNIVIDLWKRREKFIPYEEHIPLKDEEYVEYRRDAIKYFSYERIFRENF